MTDNAFTLHTEAIRANCVAAIRALPLGYRVTFAEGKHTDKQRDYFHGCCADLAKQVPLWCGVRMDLENWKRFAVAMCLGGPIVPGCDGQGQPGGGFVCLTKSTAKLGKGDYGQLIEWCQWFGAMHDVVWTYTPGTPKETPSA